MPVMTSSAVVPPRCLTNQGSAMEAQPTPSQRKGMVGTLLAMRTTVFSVLMIMINSRFITASATRKYRASISRTPNSVVPKSTGHRTTLPAHCPDNSHVGLMAILYNNIGRDLKLTPLFTYYFWHVAVFWGLRAVSPQVKTWLEFPCQLLSMSQ